MKRLFISFFLIFSVGCNEQQLGARNPDTPEKSRILQEQTAKDTNLPQQISIKISDVNNVSMDFMLIPAGEFNMGSPESEKNSWGNEHPLHHVKISKPFYMGKYEVTQSQYNEVMRLQLLSAPPWVRWRTSKFRGRTDLPVENIEWLECVYFTQILSKQFNAVFRLPTEAEWEYACRAGSTTPFYTGETISAEQA
ncbi:MAG: formylglycine-generating enzyme family protein, partial [Planctomycetota bacterium]|nr:formylglycine-generating enzyme family protein [Planctomycetota bacterium]